MSLQTRLESLIAAIGADVKADRLTMTGLASGSLSALTTTAKTSLLAAINEINAKATDPWTYQSVMGTPTTSATAAADIAGLTGFTPEASSKYIVELIASVSAAAITTGVQVGFAGPSTGITRAAVKVVSAQTATTDMISQQGLNSWQGSAASLTTPTLLTIQALVEVGATPGGGNIRPSWRSEVSASVVTMYPGSHMKWRKV